MPKTLAGAKPKLETDLKTLLQKAAYEAFKTQINSGTADNGIQSRMDLEMDQAALKFSNKFAEEAYKPMATAIYNFTKEIGITLTPMGLMSPHGPVTGTTSINTFKIS